MNAPEPSIQCPRCGAVSHHPKDIEPKYCARCCSSHYEMMRDSSFLLAAALRIFPVGTIIDASAGAMQRPGEEPISASLTITKACS
jgi:ribosomal protein L37E